MADSDKDILITPNTGAASDPSIVFSSGATGGDDVTLNVTDDGTITTLSFEGSAGQLFSITNDLTGTIFSVNDISGIPSLEVNADGTVSIAEFDGDVGIGTSSPSAQLHVIADSATTNADIPVIRITSTSTGTPATGIGPSIEFESETAAGSPGNLEIGGVLALESTDVTATTEDFDFVFSTMAAGAAAAERMRITSAGNVTATSFGGITEANLLDKTATETVSGAYSFTGGATITNGLDMGSVVAASTTDLSDHLALYSTTYGINVTSGTMNFVRSTTRQMYLESTGLTVSGDVSGTTIGGITEANLLDKTATESISGAYTFTNATTTFDNGAATQTVVIGNAASAGEKRFRLTNASHAAGKDFVISSAADTYGFYNRDSTRWDLQFDNSANTADFGSGAVTAASFGGIASANLLDKTATETVSGTYTFSNRAVLSSGFEMPDSSAYIWNLTGFATWGQYWNTTTNAVEFHSAGSANIILDLDGGTITTTGNISGGSIGGITEANLLDKTATETVSGTYTFSASPIIESTSPVLYFRDTDATVDEKNWIVRGDQDLFRIQSASDASPGSGVENAISIDRSGTDITTVTIGAGSQTLVLGGGSTGNTNYIEIGKGFDVDSGIKWNRGATTDSRIYVNAGENMYFTVDETNTLSSNSFIWQANAGTVMSLTDGGALDITGALTLGTALDEAEGGTGQTTYATGDILYASGANTLAKLAAGTNTHVLTLTGGVPTWAAPSAGSVAFNDLTSKTGGTGDYQTSGDFIADNFEATGLGPTTTPGTDDLYIGGYGIIGDRSPNSVYVSNVSGPVSLNHAGNHGSNVKLATTASGVDVTGTLAATTVTGANVTSGTDPGHTHSIYLTSVAFDDLTSKAAGTGDYLTTGDLGSGENSGGVAMTINDGYGNANLTFNHRNGTPDNTSATQSAYRIEAATDSNTATWSFEMGNSTVQDTPVALTTVSTWTTSAIDFEVNVDCNNGLDVTSGSLTLATALDETYGGTGQTTYATGDILYASGANTLAKLAAGTNTHVLTLSGGVPVWSAPTGSDFGADGTMDSGVDLAWADASQPWVTVDSTSSGDNWTAQGAGISVGESGKKGSAAIHMTYNGDGSGYIGMGTVDNTASTGGRPTYGHLDFTYNNSSIYVGGLLFPGNSAGTTGSSLIQSVAYMESADSQNYGSINCTGAAGSSGSYSGWSVNRRLVLMNSGTTSGIYNDTNNHWFLQGVENSYVSLYHAGGVELRTQQHEAAGNTSGAWTYDHVANQRDIGFNDLFLTENNPASVTVDEANIGGVIYADDNTGFTITLPSSTSSFPIGGVITIINANTTVSLTIADQASYTCFYMDPGGGRTDIAGTATLTAGGVATIWRQTTGGTSTERTFLMWGSGIIP